MITDEQNCRGKEFLPRAKRGCLGAPDGRTTSVWAHVLAALHILRVALHKAPFVWYYSTCLLCCLLAEGLRTTFQHGGRISEASSTFTRLMNRATLVQPDTLASESPCREGRSHVSQRAFLCTDAFYREIFGVGMKWSGWMREEVKGLASECVLSVMKLPLCAYSAVPVSRALLLKRTDVELNSVEQLFILMFCVHIGLLLCNALPALPILGTTPVVQYVMS